MNGTVDIIIFGIIAAVLLWRLRSVLGTRDENDPPQIQNPFTPQPKEADKNPGAPPMTLPEQIPGAPPVNWTAAQPNYDLVANATVHHRIVPFAAIDPNFRPDDFLDKAKKAYAMIVRAYAAGDKAMLQFLLSSTLYPAFEAQITKRAQGEVYQAQMHGLKSATITDASLDGTQAFVTVDFIAEQTILHKTADGAIVGDNDGSRQINHDRWVFSKNLKDSDPKWVLVQTQEID